MNTIQPLFLAVLLLVTTLGVNAEEKTAILKVDGMTCASCPYQVKKALTKIDGVKQADVALDTREATVTFDDIHTNIATLTEATGNAGFPSTLKAVN